MQLKEIRKKMHLTQSEFADLLGITRNYLALIETGKRNASADLVKRASQIVNKDCQQPTESDWRTRALRAESELARLRNKLQQLLEEG